MQQKFPKDITDAMRGCILAIFWSKNDIISFLENNGCTTNDLRVVKKNKAELSRSDIVDTVFQCLFQRTDSGLGQFRAMLQRIIEWDYFDPYYFETLRKLDESAARRAIEHLKQLQEIRDAKIQAQQAATLERLKKAEEKARSNSLDQLRDRKNKGKDPEFDKRTESRIEGIRKKNPQLISDWEEQYRKWENRKTEVSPETEEFIREVSSKRIRKKYQDEKRNDDISEFLNDTFAKPDESDDRLPF